MRFNLNSLLNNKFLVVYFIPFLLGSLTVFSFEPYNLTFVNFFSFSILLYLILVIKKKTLFKYRKKKSNRYYFYLGCAFGFGFFLFGNYWISISLTHDAMFRNLIPFALILIPLFLSIFFGLVVFIVGPFSEKNINALLQENTERFMADSFSGLRSDGKEIELSQIFEWYIVDFGGKDSLLQWITNNSIQDLSQSKLKGFISYSWELNNK